MMTNTGHTQTQNMDTGAHTLTQAHTHAHTHTQDKMENGDDILGQYKDK